MKYILDKVASMLVNMLSRRFMEISGEAFTDHIMKSSITLKERNEYLSAENERINKDITLVTDKNREFAREKSALLKEIETYQDQVRNLSDMLHVNNTLLTESSSKDKKIASLLIKYLKVNMGDTKEPTIKAVLEEYDSQKEIVVNENRVNAPELEQRYFVVKIRDLYSLSTIDSIKLSGIFDKIQANRKKKGKTAGIQCVVVEEDWDIYPEVVELVKKGAKINA